MGFQDAQTPRQNWRTFMSLLGLEKLQPEGRRSAKSKFSVREWGEIRAARKRGVSWGQIQAATKRYISANTLRAAYSLYLKAKDERKSVRETPKRSRKVFKIRRRRGRRPQRKS
jgi:hypothetical protein